MQRNEKKLIIEIKQLAKKGQLGAAKIMAKDLVRTRNGIKKVQLQNNLFMIYFLICYYCSSTA